MRALRWDGSLRVDLAAARPRPRPGEALIRVRMAGICNTDLEVVHGYKSFRGVLGHEFVGEVVDCDDGRWTGRRVCGEINVGCGECERCAAENRGHCARRQVLGMLGRDGAFADFLTLPVVNLHAVPRSLADEAAVFVEPLAAAYEILQQVSLDPAMRVVVLGDGKLGLLCVQVLATSGADVTLVGKHPDKLSLAASWSVRTTLLASAGCLEADVVVEATGTAGGIERAAEIVRPRGTIVLKTTVADAAPIDLSPIVVKEVTVVGSRCGPFDRAIEGLSGGGIDVTSLVDACYPLSEGLAAMEHAARPGALKVLLDMRSDSAMSL